MPVFAFSLIMALLSFTLTIFIVMLIVRAVNRAQRIRQEMFAKVLESGIYDYRLLRGRRRGVAPLGWGLFFIAVGVALIIGLTIMGIFTEGAIGALIPFFIGLGLIIYYVLVKKQTAGEADNDKPIRFDVKVGEPPAPPAA